MYVLYSFVTAAGMLLLSPYFLVRSLLSGRHLDNIPERLGWRFPPELNRNKSGASKEKSIWIHAVSVGEVLAVLPLARQLKARYPQKRLVVSTTTETGQNLARERMEFADAVFYFPLDWRGPVRRALSATGAAIVIIVETEIWPNFLRECRRAQVPVIFVNGRLSERSFRGYRRALSCTAGLLRGFLARILDDATVFLMQSQGDATRLLALGAPAKRVLVTGNLKYDTVEPPENPLSIWLREETENNHRGPIVVAGSVMADEEASVLRAFSDVEREYPNALLVLAPRKPDQFDRAADIVGQTGHKFLRRRDISLNGTRSATQGQPWNVLLLDSLGELAGIYRLADAVFVGGSLVPVGGHNILEPAVFSKVPIFGPSMENFRELATNFLEAGAAIQVSSPEGLGVAWCTLLKERDRAATMGDAAQKLIEQNRGATNRVLAHIERIMDLQKVGT